jgi:hypothetical protein
MGEERQLLRRRESRKAGEDVDLSIGPNLASRKTFSEEALVYPYSAEVLTGEILEEGAFPTGQRPRTTLGRWCSESPRSSRPFLTPPLVISLPIVGVLDAIVRSLGMGGRSTTRGPLEDDAGVTSERGLHHTLLPLLIRTREHFFHASREVPEATHIVVHLEDLILAHEMKLQTHDVRGHQIPLESDDLPNLAPFDSAHERFSLPKLETFAREGNPQGRAGRLSAS